jgi:hypothetical protein
MTSPFAWALESIISQVELACESFPEQLPPIQEQEDALTYAERLEQNYLKPFMEQLDVQEHSEHIAHVECVLNALRAPAPATEEQEVVEEEEEEVVEETLPPISEESSESLSQDPVRSDDAPEGSAELALEGELFNANPEDEVEEEILQEEILEEENLETLVQPSNRISTTIPVPEPDETPAAQVEQLDQFIQQQTEALGQTQPGSAQARELEIALERAQVLRHHAERERDDPNFENYTPPVIAPTHAFHQSTFDPIEPMTFQPVDGGAPVIATPDSGVRFNPIGPSPSRNGSSQVQLFNPDGIRRPGTFEAPEQEVDRVITDRAARDAMSGTQAVYRMNAPVGAGRCPPRPGSEEMSGLDWLPHCNVLSSPTFAASDKPQLERCLDSIKSTILGGRSLNSITRGELFSNMYRLLNPREQEYAAMVFTAIGEAGVLAPPIEEMVMVMHSVKNRARNATERNPGRHINELDIVLQDRQYSMYNAPDNRRDDQGARLLNNHLKSHVFVPHNRQSSNAIDAFMRYFETPFPDEYNDIYHYHTVYVNPDWSRGRRQTDIVLNGQRVGPVGGNARRGHQFFRNIAWTFRGNQFR